MEETKITKNTSMSGIITAVSKMQEMYPNEPLMIVSEGYWNKIKSEVYQQGARDFAKWVNHQDLEMYGADEMLRFWKEERKG